MRSLILLLLLTLCACTEALAVTPTHTSVSAAISSAYMDASGVIYAGIGPDIKRSTDNGATWSAALLTIPNGSLSVFIDSAGAIYASAGGNAVSSANSGLWRSADNGGTWTRVLPLYSDGSSYQECIWGITEANGSIFAGVYTNSATYAPPYTTANANCRIYKSTGGTSWASVYYNPNQRHVHAIVADPYHTTGGVNNLYATVGDSPSSALFLKSTDNGTTWNQILPALTQCVAVVCTPTARLFGNDQGSGTISRSTDDVTFNVVHSAGNADIYYWIVQDPTNLNIYAGQVTGSNGSTANILMSTDDGVSFSSIMSMSVPLQWDGSYHVSNILNGKFLTSLMTGNIAQNGILWTTNSGALAARSTATMRASFR